VHIVQVILRPFCCSVTSFIAVVIAFVASCMLHAKSCMLHVACCMFYCSCNRGIIRTRYTTADIVLAIGSTNAAINYRPVWLGLRRARSPVSGVTVKSRMAGDAP